MGCEGIGTIPIYFKIGLKGIPDRSTSSASLFSSFCDQECAAWEDNESGGYLCFFLSQLLGQHLMVTGNEVLVNETWSMMEINK